MTNEDYKELYDSATVGLWRTTIDEGLFINVNSAVAHILGYDDVEDLVGTKSSNLYERDAFVEELKEIQEIENFEVCMEKKDGSFVWVSISAKIYPEKGYIEGSIRDISCQKRQEACFIPHLQKLSCLKQSIMNRLKQDDYYQSQGQGQNKSLKTA